MTEGIEGVALYEAARELSGAGLEPGEPLVFMLSCAAAVLSLLVRKDGP